MADKNQLPDWRDEKALAKWLEQFPRPLITAFACRMALLALPGLGRLTLEQMKTFSGGSLVMTSCRAIVSSWVAAKHPAYDFAGAARAAAAAFAALAESEASIDLESNYSAAFAAADAASVARAAGAGATMSAASLAAGISRRVNEISPQTSERGVGLAIQDLSAARLDKAPATWYLSRPLFKNAEDGKAHFTLLRGIFGLFGRFQSDERWIVWLDWAEARFFGLPDWPAAVYDKLTEWAFTTPSGEPISRDDLKGQLKSKWDRPPAEVNADIKRLLEEHARPATPLPGPGPTTPIVIRENKLDFGESNTFEGSDAEALRKHGAELCKQLLQANFDVPPDLKAALSKLDFWLSKELGSISPIELRIAVTALVARVESYAIVAPDDLSVRTMSALRELNETTRGLLELVIPDLRANALAIQALNLSSLPAQVVESTIEKSVNLYQESPAIAPRVAEQHKLTVEISRTANDQTVRIVAQGNAILQTQEIVRTLAQHLSDQAPKQVGTANEGAWLIDESSKAALQGLIVSLVSLVAGTDPTTSAILFGTGFVWLRYYARQLFGGETSTQPKRTEPTLDTPKIKVDRANGRPRKGRTNGKGSKRK